MAHPPSFAIFSFANYVPVLRIIGQVQGDNSHGKFGPVHLTKVKGHIVLNISISHWV